MYESTQVYLDLSNAARVRRERRRNLCIAICSLSGGVLWLVAAMAWRAIG